MNHSYRSRTVPFLFVKACCLRDVIEKYRDVKWNIGFPPKKRENDSFQKNLEIKKPLNKLKKKIRIAF